MGTNFNPQCAAGGARGFLNGNVKDGSARTDDIEHADSGGRPLGQ